MYPQMTFDIPVSINKMYIRLGSRVVLTEAARNWKEYAILMARLQWHCEPIAEEVVVSYYFYGSRADWDNPCKILGDAMEGICYLNDNQIVEAHIYLKRKDTNRRVEVEIHRKQGSSL